MKHEIINLKDFGKKNFATSRWKVDLENIACEMHSLEKCFVFCNKCSEPTCTQFLMETHKMPGYKDLDEVYYNTIAEMKEFI